MKSGDDRIDLSALDPEVDPERLERVVRHVMDGLGPGMWVDEAPSAVDVVSRYVVTRALRICAGAAAVALLTHFATGLSSPDADVPRAAVVPRMTLPVEWAAWIANDATPSTETLLTTLTAGRD